MPSSSQSVFHELAQPCGPSSASAGNDVDVEEASDGAFPHVWLVATWATGLVACWRGVALDRLKRLEAGKDGVLGLQILAGKLVAQMILLPKCY